MSPDYTYVLAYLDTDLLHLLERDLKKSKEYLNVKPLIPMVRVLKKHFKGEDIFEEVPLLMNYGFFQIPRVLAVSAIFLENMKTNINCIYAWVRDPAKMLVAPGKIDKNATYKDHHVPAATATSEEIATLLDEALKTNIYSGEDIKNLKKGDLVVLRGYPWEGLEGEVVSVDEKRKKVKVSIFLFNQIKELEVPFDSVFFTLYRGEGYKDDLSKNQSLDEMQERRTLDKFTSKNQNHGD